MFSMFRKMICLISFVLVLCLAGFAQADNNYWDDVTGSGLWNDAENWSLGHVPAYGDGDTAALHATPGPIVKAAGMGAQFIWMVGHSDLTIDGGELRTNGLTAGNDPSTISTVTVNSGTFVNTWETTVGREGSGTFTMNGGLADLYKIIVGWASTAVGHVQLNGGVITTGGFEMRTKAGSVGTMDIRAGTLIINGDNLSSVQGYIDNGWITAYDGYGTLHLDYDVTNEGKTTLKAVHMLNPNPLDGSTVLISVNQLQWTLPEPNQTGGVVTCDVYLGTNPNVEANPKVVTGQAVESLSVTLAPDTIYYWTLDLYDSSISTTKPFHLSPIFTFNTLNTAPVVDAGEDVATWLDNGVQLGGVVSDEDGGPGPATLLWTVIAEPNELNPAQISDSLAANPTVTVMEPGTYTLQLEAGDGEYTTADTMQIVVYADSCEHAKNQEGFELIPGDINEDCIVNELDIVLLIEHWLEENYSTE